MDKILLVSNMYPSEDSPNYGVFVKNFVESLEKKGVRFELIVIKGKNKSVIIKALKYVVFVIRIIKSFFFKYENYYVHYANHSLIPFLFLGNMQKRKIIINFHGSDLFYESVVGRYLSYLTKKVVLKATRVVVPSVYFKEEVIKRFNIPENKIFVSPSGGINLKLFKRDNYRKSESNSLKLIYIGRLDYQKGFDLIIHALEKLRYCKIDVMFNVIGGGSLFDKYKQDVKNKNLASVVNFMGMLDQKKLPELLNGSDVFVFPSYRKGESLGLVGLEAMACGVPVIGSDIGGIRSYLIDGFNGFLFNKGDSNGLYERIIKFNLLSHEEKAKMSINAVNTAKKYEDIKVANQMYAFLNEVYS